MTTSAWEKFKNISPDKFERNFDKYLNSMVLTPLDMFAIAVRILGSERAAELAVRKLSDPSFIKKLKQWPKATNIVSIALNKEMSQEDKLQFFKKLFSNAEFGYTPSVPSPETKRNSNDSPKNYVVQKKPFYDKLMTKAKQFLLRMTKPNGTRYYLSFRDESKNPPNSMISTYKQLNENGNYIVEIWDVTKDYHLQKPTETYLKELESYVKELREKAKIDTEIAPYLLEKANDKEQQVKDWRRYKNKRIEVSPEDFNRLFKVESLYRNGVHAMTEEDMKKSLDIIAERELKLMVREVVIGVFSE